MKKAIAIQFTWVFVLIVGAMLFAFFMNVIGKQKDMAEQGSDVKTRDIIGNILKIAEATPNTFNSHEIPNKPIVFDCTEPTSSSFSIGKKGSKGSLATNVVFMQEVMKSNKLYTWTLDWKIPYRAATFVYATTPRTRYVFYKSDIDACASLMDWLLEDWPEEIEKTVVSGTPAEFMEEVVSKGYDSNVFVQFGTDCRAVDYEDAANRINAMDSRLSDEDEDGLRGGEEVHMITIVPFVTDNNVVNKNHGELFFYKRHAYPGEHGDSDLYYYRKEMLLGAIFAPQKDLYECTMLKAFTRAQLVSELNYRRVYALDDDTGTTGSHLSSRYWCDDLYGHIKYAFMNTTYPYCGNIKIIDDIILNLQSGTSLLDSELLERNGEYCPTANSCQNAPGPYPCKENPFQRIDDNYNRLVRDARDISTVGNCPYVY
ncbi:MAG: hypothetical protein KKG59_00275 [Nanoarchaeota archaeon]|nr:hypothetical protein [Nanoarchaeota archaeon]